jgi:hypothetical protein
MKKNSALEGRELTHCSWAPGDLVKINIHDWDATPHSYTGIIVSVEGGRIHKQMDMFPMIKVFNFNTGEVNKIYSYNLEILSPHQ